MAFKFENDAVILGNELPQEDIRKIVINNLSDRGYQFIGKETNDYTHDLTIHIGSIHSGSTPDGFSFSSGNSNSRSLAFQKANTIPLTCSLMPRGQRLQHTELVMEIKAEEYKDLSINTVSEEKVITRISEDISKICLNLLSSLSIKTIKKESETKIVTPILEPKAQVETENEIGINNHNKNLNLESNKQVIIDHQDNPVIFKFGPDRQ
ncbi:MAG: hypothetical protein KAH20_15385 [Methylococcales bacterium]|nr:hypothetical protein [Methylococcales bacterium]